MGDVVALDNCRLVADVDPSDTDGDGLGDACDPDADAVSTDTTVVAGDDVRYFLVRVGNMCGEGSVGTDSIAAERVGLDCP